MKHHPLLCRAALAVAALSSVAASGQGVKARILAPIDNANRATLVDSRSPRALPANDAGALAPDTRLQGISIVFRRSDAQQADLEALIAAQQDPTSALYHQWLTPEQFASRFGIADSDLTKVENWLQSQGFAVEGISRGRDRIQFSGTAAQVASAFGSPLHRYQADGITHFAPSADLSVPAALAGTVLGIRNLSDFRPAPQARFGPVRPQFTSAQSSGHYLTPKDVSTIYDVNAAYSAGFNGANQSIAVVGQSSVVVSDITNFQTAAGVTVKAPTLVLVPGSGSALLSAGDEAESDLDLEYTSGLAPGASIFFVYTGANTNFGAFDALQYAISERVAPIISVSYGECEAVLGASNYTTLNAVLAQAAAQGQTIVAAAGDEGSTGCSGVTSITAAQQQVVSTIFPASSQYVTSMGGTEFPASAVATTNTAYWTSASGSDVIGSALGYIPEQVWNDDSATTGLSAGGGGISMFTPRPGWQTGVPGIPAGSFRLVPDVSLSSSPNNAGYLYCSSDSSTKVTGSCANGFRDANGQYLTVAGGTSFAAPIFAGMLALINQARNAAGQGVVNPILYSLAANPATYASAFHDITTGTIACTAGTTFCSAAGAAVYAAGSGYDEASGIGSVDLYKLLTAWPVTSVSALASTVTRVVPASTLPISGASDAVTITVAPSASASSVIPTGTVSITVDGSVVSASAPLANGVAGYVFTSTVAGTHVITATYSGDAVYAGSTGTAIINVGGTAGIFTVAAPALTVANSSSSSSTITVTPANGYTGTVAWTLSTNSNLNNACYTINNAVVTGTAPVTSTLTISAGAAQCATAVRVKGTGFTVGRFGGITAANHVPAGPLSSVPAAFTLATLLGLGFAGRVRFKKHQGLFCILLLASLSVALVGCGDNSGSGPPASSLAPTGNFQITLTGTDTVNNSIQSSSTFVLTIK